MHTKWMRVSGLSSPVKNIQGFHSFMVHPRTLKFVKVWLSDNYLKRK